MVTPEPTSDRKVVVFDLDDTLYKEADYRRSGLNFVCRMLASLYGLSLTLQVRELERQPDPLADLCALLGLPAQVKESLLWSYRLHLPEIVLSQGMAHVLGVLSARQHAIAVLTDGRSVTQRLKLQALGLQALPVYISEEHGGEKPHPARFEKIMRELPSRAGHVYIGDNPRKDFVAPNALGWTTLCLCDDGRNIHPQQGQTWTPAQTPMHWVHDPLDIIELIC
jgi:putative hydrolase of the HAD superfamily